MACLGVGSMSDYFIKILFVHSLQFVRDFYLFVHYFYPKTGNRLREPQWASVMIVEHNETESGRNLIG